MLDLIFPTRESKSASSLSFAQYLEVILRSAKGELRHLHKQKIIKILSSYITPRASKFFLFFSFLIFINEFFLICELETLNIL
jgi:hypothetical protein